MQRLPLGAPPAAAFMQEPLSYSGPFEASYPGKLNDNLKKMKGLVLAHLFPCHLTLWRDLKGESRLWDGSGFHFIP